MNSEWYSNINSNIVSNNRVKQTNREFLSQLQDIRVEREGESKLLCSIV